MQNIIATYFFIFIDKDREDIISIAIFVGNVSLWNLPGAIYELNNINQNGPTPLQVTAKSIL